MAMLLTASRQRRKISIRLLVFYGWVFPLSDMIMFFYIKGIISKRPFTRVTRILAPTLVYGRTSLIYHCNWNPALLLPALFLHPILGLAQSCVSLDKIRLSLFTWMASLSQWLVFIMVHGLSHGAGTLLIDLLYFLLCSKSEKGESTKCATYMKSNLGFLVESRMPYSCGKPPSR